MTKKVLKRDNFDFEIGYITHSPCLTCEEKNGIPDCFDKCRLLDKMRGVLAGGISTQASTFRR